MRLPLLPCAVLLAASPVQAQTGPFLHADLQYAAHVCTDTTYSTDAEQEGIGAAADLNAGNRGCLFGNEHQGVWMHFQAATAGQVGFTIAPSQPADYDFGVWGPFMEPPWMVESAPVRCSFAGLQGAAGLNYTAQDLTEAAGGDNWVRYLDVQAGEWYVLYVDNFIMNGIGFALTWQLQGGATLTCLQPPVSDFDVSPGPHTQGAAVDFTDASSNHPFAWYWAFPNGVPATSVERDPQGVVFTTVGCNAAQLTVYNAAGSSTTDQPCAVLVEVNTGVSVARPADFELRQEAGLLRVLPADPGRMAEVRVLDLRGRVVASANGTGAVLVPLERMAPGLYAVEVVQHGARATRAVVVGPQ